MTKLGAGNRAACVSQAVSWGLVSGRLLAGNESAARSA
jgi:hypothetical protein